MKENTNKSNINKKLTKKQRKKADKKAKKLADKNGIITVKDSISKESLVKPLYVLIGLLVLTLITYYPSFNNGFVNWDDPLYVYENPRVLYFNFSNFLKMWTLFPDQYLAANYHPLTEISLGIDQLIYGGKSSGFHLTSTLFHALNSILVYLLAIRLLKGNQVAAIIASILFVVHPMRVESVAWIAERKDVLHVFFFLLGLLQYIKYVDRQKAKKHLIFAGLFFVCSLLSKAQAVTFPLILVLIDYLRGRRDLIKCAIEKAPFFILSLLFGVLAIYAQRSAAADTLVNIETWQRPFTASMALLIYIKKLFIPTGLCVIHEYPFKGGMPMTSYFYPALLGFIGYIGAIYYLYKKNKSVWVFGLSFFLIAILPVLQFLTVGAVLWSERYTYLPYVGLFILIGYTIASMKDSTDLQKYRTLGLGLFGVVSIGFLLMSWQRIEVWKDNQTLWDQVRKVHPNNMTPYANLALHHTKLEDWDTCIKYADMGLEKRPSFARLYPIKSFCQTQKNDYQSALSTINTGLTYAPNNSKLLLTAGGNYLKLKNYDKAIEYYGKSIEQQKNLNAYANRGTLYTNQKRNYRAAIQDFEEALKFDPTNLTVLLNIAVTHLQLPNGAVNGFKYADQAVKSYPKNGNCWLMRARCHAGQGQYTQAINDAQRAKSLGASQANQFIQEWQRR